MKTWRNCELLAIRYFLRGEDHEKMALQYGKRVHFSEDKHT